MPEIEAPPMLEIQNAALLRRCSAKDAEFAKERESWKRKEAGYKRQIQQLSRELRAAKKAEATCPAN